MNVKLNQSNKRIEALKEKLSTEIAKNRKHQKAKNYYRSKLEN